MLQLNADKNFHFELLRILATVRGYGADVTEVLNVCEKIVPGDFESWYKHFHDLALWVKSSIDPDHDYHQVTLRDAYFRASRYFFAAQFFLHGQPDDPRLQSSWEEWVELFDKALSLLDIPGERRMLKADGFEVPVILLRTSTDNQPRPVLILGNGLDGSMEEAIHFHGFQALERGWHVVLYEGPGQPTVRRRQNIGFIPEWEKVVTPVVDYLESLPFVNTKCIGLLGISLGGFLAARAAAFEHRLAAVILIDAIYDLYQTLGQQIGVDTMEYEQNGSEDAFQESVLRIQETSTHLKWLSNQLNWAFMSTTYGALQRSKKMTLAGVAGQIQCPVFVGDAEQDIFVEVSQPRLMAEALGSKATWKRFTVEESADAHCHAGATVFLNQVVLEWFQDQIRNRQGRSSIHN